MSTLLRTAPQTLTEQLAERFAGHIRDRLLAPGTRLPSVRQCAQQQRVSPSTVVAAYDQLQAQGLIEARRNRGFFVRDQSGRATARRLMVGAAQAQTSPTDADRTALNSVLQAVPKSSVLLRGMFDPVGPKPQPGAGVLPVDWLNTDFLAAAVRRMCAPAMMAKLGTSYGEPAGDGPLRQALAARLNDLHVPATPQQIITTVGATQALDLVSRTLLKPGDSVMVEEPGWSVEFARLAALGMRLLPVPRRPEGPDLDVMSRYCEAHAGTPEAPRLYVSVSVLHNPTGSSLSPAHAHRVLQLAQQHDFHIVEDDSYCHLAPEHATRLSVLDGLQRCIYVSGFSKILAPGWRVGYLAAPPALVEPLLDTKLLATLTSPALLERALAHCIEQGQLRRHAERIRTKLDGARSRSVRLARQAGVRFVSEPAGLFGWVDTGVDTERLALRLLDEGYLLAPGSLFSPLRAPSTMMRINFSTTQNAEFWRHFEAARDRL